MNFFSLIFLAGCICAVFISKYSIRSFAGCMFLFCLVSFPPCVKVLGFSPSTIVSYTTILYTVYRIFVVKEKKTVGTSLLLGVFIVYSSAFVISLPFSASMNISSQLPALKQFLLDMLVPLSMVFLYRKSDECLSIQRFTLILVLITCIYGIYTYSIGTNLYSLLVQIHYPEANDFEQYMEEERAGLEGRIGGFIGHPVFYAGLLMILFYLVLGFSMQMLKKGKRIWFYFSVICILAIVLNIFLSGTRSAMVATAVGLVYYGVKVLSYSKLSIIVLAFVGMVGVMATFPIFGKYQPMVDSIVYFWDDDKTSGEIKGSSVSMRLNQLDGTFEIISGAKIFFGNGAGWVRKYMEKNGKHPVLLGFESLLFSGLVQYGVLGFLLIYGGLFGSMIYVNQKLNHKTEDRCLINALVISYIVYAILTGAFCFPTFLMVYIVLMKSVLLLGREELSKKLLLSMLLKNIKGKTCSVVQ